MVTVQLKRVQEGPGRPWATDVNQLVDLNLGNRGGMIRLRGYSGDVVQIGDKGSAGTVITSNGYPLNVQSPIGFHGAFVLSATSSTAAPTAANSALLIQDAGVFVGVGKVIRLYDAAGTDYAQLAADADGGLVLTGSGASAGLFTLGGGIVVTGLGKFFEADMSNATLTNRFYFRTTAVNTATGFSVEPNGTATSSGVLAANSSNRAAFGYILTQMFSTDGRLTVAHVGASYLPLTIYTNGAEVARFATDGSLTVGSQTAIATVGKIRFNNNQGIVERNAGNTADVDLIGLNASDQILINSFANADILAGATGKLFGLLGTVYAPNIDPPTREGQVTSESQCKAYLYYDVGGAAIGDSYNIASVTKNGTGDFTVFINRDFAAATYAVVATIQDNGATLFHRINGQAVGSFDIHFRNVAGVLTDPDAFGAACFGTLS